MRIFVYVDGFNFYYRAVQGTRFKWLDLKTLVAGLLAPSDQIVAIKYYTAHVTGRADPDQPRRQQLYLNALKTIPGLSIHFGHFLAKTKRRPLVNPPPGGPRTAEFHDTEEKGSDVNLASHLIHDGWRDVYDAAVVVSKDTDLVEPMRLVIRDLRKPVGLICPDGVVPPQLRQVASFVRHVTAPRLAAAQFPDPVVAADGRLIHKPASW